MKRLFGFTLAETLIVMGIIGVVAALTLPNLNSSTGDKEKVAKVKKIYSNLNDVMGRATVVYGDYSSWGTNVTKIAGRLTDFMKLSKDCGTSGSGCFSTNVTTDTSSSFSVSNSAFYKVILADGTSLSIGPYYKTSMNSYIPVGQAQAAIYVDIDGPNKGANTSAKDVFAFFISDKGEIIPYGDFYNSNTTLLTCDCFSHGAIECTSWVVMNDNMDYLKCPSKLSLTNTTCK